MLPNEKGPTFGQNSRYFLFVSLYFAKLDVSCVRHLFHDTVTAIGINRPFLRTASPSSRSHSCNYLSLNRSSPRSCSLSQEKAAGTLCALAVLGAACETDAQRAKCSGEGALTFSWTIYHVFNRIRPHLGHREWTLARLTKGLWRASRPRPVREVQAAYFA